MRCRACQNEIRGRGEQFQSSSSALVAALPSPSCPSLASLQILLPPTDPRVRGPPPSIPLPPSSPIRHRPAPPLSLLRPPRRPLLFITLLHSLAFGCCWLVPFLRVARTHPQGDDTHTERGKGRRGRGRQPQWARHKRSGGRTHARDSPEIQDPRDPLAPVASQSPERILVHGGRRGARRVL